MLCRGISFKVHGIPHELDTIIIVAIIKIEIEAWVNSANQPKVVGDANSK